jgi:hypothetical protein
VCALAGVTTLAQLEAYVRQASPDDADAVQARLAARASGGDGLAARVLLQLLLGSARRLARTACRTGDGDQRAAAAVGAVYDRIRRYRPTAVPSRRVAVAIVMAAAADIVGESPPRHRLALTPD